MRVTAIISEYNPLHSGHAYHIARAAAETNPDALAVIMSGSLTQRGDFAVCGKYMRASWAVKAGADIVLELPVINAVSSAEKFAEGGVKLLSVFDNPTLSFGSECGNLKLLCGAADCLGAESAEFKAHLSLKLKEGKTYAKARSEAAKSTDCAAAEIMDTPNNILALEYIKAARGKDIALHTVKRLGGGYNDGSLDREFASATAVRTALFNGNFNDIIRFLPDFVAVDLKNFACSADISDILLYKLAAMTAEEIGGLYEIGEGLENRISRYAKYAKSYEELIAKVKTKRYTLAKIKRVMLYALLDLTKQKAAELLAASPYFNVLALKEGRNDILSEIGKRTDNLVVKNGDIQKLADSTRKLAELDLFAARISAVLGVSDIERPF